MKKLFYIFVILIFGLSIVACSGNKKEEAKVEEKAATVETQSSNDRNSACLQKSAWHHKKSGYFSLSEPFLCFLL